MGYYSLESDVACVFGKMEFPNVSDLGESLSNFLKSIIPGIIRDLGDMIKTKVDSILFKQQSKETTQASKFVLVTIPQPSREKIQASKPTPSHPLPLFAFAEFSSDEMALESAISDLPSREDLIDLVFNNPDDKEVNLSGATEVIEKDMKRGTKIRLNGKDYTNTSHIREFAKELSSDLRLNGKTLSEEKRFLFRVLIKILREFNGDRDCLREALKNAFPSMENGDMQRLNDVILQKATHKAVGAFRDDLLKILGLNIDELDKDQQERLKVVLLQCSQAGAAPLVANYIDNFMEPSIAGLPIRQTDEQNTITGIGLSNQNSAATYTVTASRKEGVITDASYPLNALGYDGNKTFTLANLEGTVTARFSLKGKEFIPETAHAELRLQKLYSPLERAP